MLAATLGDLLLHLVHNGVGKAGVGTRGNYKVIADVGELRQVKDANVLGPFYRKQPERQRGATVSAATPEVEKRSRLTVVARGKAFVASLIKLVFGNDILVNHVVGDNLGIDGFCCHARPFLLSRKQA